MDAAGGEELFEAPAVKQQPWGVARGEHLQECKERQTWLAAMTLDNCQLVTILNEGDLWVVSYQWPWLGPHALENAHD